MKTSKLFTIDIDLAERLKNVNGSAIVNTLLKEYFELRSDKNTLKDEKKAVFDAISKKKSNFLKRLKLWKSGSHLIWITFRENGFKLEKGYLHLVKFLFIGTVEELELRFKTFKERLSCEINMENF